MSGFPVRRLRRLRRDERVRRFVQETDLDPSHLIAPLFVVPGEDVQQPIGSMPGQSHFSADKLVEEVRRLSSLGVSAVLLFGVPDRKDERASEAYDDGGVVQDAVRAIRHAHDDVLIITDVCLCAYTDHGHCGVVIDGRIDNDATLPLLVEQAVSHARAGADVVAPSDMMDGRVGAIRAGLDEADLQETLILSYAAKYASAFYGPFRDAAHSTPQFGDRRSHQMAPSARREARLEIAMDADEGADLVMVKPAMPYLDIISDARQATDLPLVAYQVSGELGMLEAAAANGWLDRKAAILESLVSIRRAGADRIITYFAGEVAGWLGGD